MKRRNQLSIPLRVVAVCVVATICAEARIVFAGAFHNLGFEDADVTQPLSGSKLLPYWTNNNLYPDHNPYDDIYLDSVGISIHDNLDSIHKPLVGDYSVLLQDGNGEGGTPPYYLTSAYISQTGSIPSWAKSLTFKSDTSTYISELQVSIDGTAIPFTLHSMDGTVNPTWGPVKTYILDVSAYAGDTVTLKFEKLVHDPTNPCSHGFVDLDAIQFSMVVVPEPATMMLAAIGVLLLAGSCCRRLKRA